MIIQLLLSRTLAVAKVHSYAICYLLLRHTQSEYFGASLAVSTRMLNWAQVVACGISVPVSTVCVTVGAGYICLVPVTLLQ